MRASSTLICMPYSQIFERGKPRLDRDWSDVRRSREPITPAGRVRNPLRLIPADEPANGADSWCPAIVRGLSSRLGSRAGETFGAPACSAIALSTPLSCQKKSGIIQGDLGLLEAVLNEGFYLLASHMAMPSAFTALASSECRSGPDCHSAREKATGTTTIPSRYPASQAQSLT